MHFIEVFFISNCCTVFNYQSVFRHFVYRKSGFPIERLSVADPEDVRVYVCVEEGGGVLDNFFFFFFHGEF